jgi:hypothetical protein
MAWQLPRLPRPSPIAIQIRSESLESDLSISAAEKESADKAAETEALTMLDPNVLRSDVDGVIAPEEELGEELERSSAEDPVGGESLTDRQDRERGQFPCLLVQQISRCWATTPTPKQEGSQSRRAAWQFRGSRKGWTTLKK